MSAGFFPAVIAATSSATPLGYAIGAVAGLLAFIVGRALWMAGRNWKVDAKIKERLSSDSSPFEPMARVYENKRLFLKDLIPPGGAVIVGRTFINCEIIGPGNIVVNLRSSEKLPFPVFRGNLHVDVDFVQIDTKVTTKNAIHFPDCGFDGCTFYKVNLLFYQRHPADVGDPMHAPWITPQFAPMALIEDGTNVDSSTDK